MQKTKIEWVRNPDGSQGYVWNPVRGCLHNCDFCFARRIDKRFGDGTFTPTFHPERLQDPLKVKKPSRIFVGSMADLFGDWMWEVSKEPGTITSVNKAYVVDKILQIAKQCPQHTFMFLTKNPKGMQGIDFPANCWCGTSVENQEKADERIPELLRVKCKTLFVSLEPILGPINFDKWIRGENDAQCRTDIPFTGSQGLLLNKQQRTDMATQADDWGKSNRESLIRKNLGNSSKSGTKFFGRLSQSDVQLQPREDGNICPQDNMDAFQQCRHSERNADKSQRRDSEQLPSGQPGVSHSESKCASRDSCFGEKEQKSRWRNECASEIDKSGCFDHSGDVREESNVSESNSSNIWSQTGNDFRYSSRKVMEKRCLKWLIIGAQTGPGAVKPDPEWIESAIQQARSAGVPVFVKDNVKWPEQIQEWPEGVSL